MAISLNSGQEMICLLTHLDPLDSVRLAVDLVISCLASFQTSDQRRAGGKFQSGVLDIRIKEWRHSSAKP